MLMELHVSYNTKLPGLYDEWYEQGYWAGYEEVKRVANGS